jgi:hypothetical protein
MGDEVCGVSMREVKAFVESGSVQQQCCMLFLSTIFIDAGTILYLVSLKVSDILLRPAAVRRPALRAGFAAEPQT